MTQSKLIGVQLWILCLRCAGDILSGVNLNNYVQTMFL